MMVYMVLVLDDLYVNDADSTYGQDSRECFFPVVCWLMGSNSECLRFYK